MKFRNVAAAIILSLSTVSCTSHYVIGIAESRLDAEPTLAGLPIIISGDAVFEGKARNPAWQRATADFRAHDVLVNVLSDIDESVDADFRWPPGVSQISIGVDSISFDENRIGSGTMPEIEICISMQTVNSQRSTVSMQCSGVQEGPLVRHLLSGGGFSSEDRLVKSYGVAFELSLQVAVLNALERSFAEFRLSDVGRSRLGIDARSDFSGDVIEGFYFDAKRKFKISLPWRVPDQIFDGEGRYMSYVDFVEAGSAFSIEFYDQAEVTGELSYRQGTLSFMQDYIPNKCGTNSFDSVDGEFVRVGDRLSYEFATEGFSPKFGPTYWFGRSSYLGERTVGICMYFEHRDADVDRESFLDNLDTELFDSVCSSITPLP